MEGKQTRSRAVLLALVILLAAVVLIGPRQFWDSLASRDPREVLTGKKILIMGDSITGGYGIEDYSLTWCGMLETECGMEVTCNSVNGSTVSAAEKYGYYVGACYWPISYRETPEGDFDVVFVQGGSNDWRYELPLGEDPDSRDTYCFMGALNVTIDRLQEAYPDALLLFSTPWNSDGSVSGLGYALEDYTQAVLDVCQRRGIACFEACDPEVSGIDAASWEFRSTYFLTQNDMFHMNEAGHELFFPAISRWFGEMLREWETD